MKKALLALAGVLLVSACVQLPDILETNAVNTAFYAGSQADMAECVRISLPGGKVQRSPDGSKIDVYDSKKAWSGFGITHYAVSVYDFGFIELRKLPEGYLTKEGRERLWVPIQSCIKESYQARNSGEDDTTSVVVTLEVPAGNESWLDSGVVI